MKLGSMRWLSGSKVVAIYLVLDLGLPINREGHPVLVERALLDPHSRPLSSPDRHGKFLVAGPLNIAGSESAPPDVTCNTSLLVGIDRRDDRTQLRLLGSRTDFVRDCIEAVVSGPL